MHLSWTASFALSFLVPVAATATASTTAKHKVRRRSLALAFQEDPCLVIQQQTDSSKEQWPWKCELSPKDAQAVGGKAIVPIEGMTDHDFRTMEGMLIHGGYFQQGRLVLPPGSTPQMVSISSFMADEVNYAMRTMDMNEVEAVMPAAALLGDWEFCTCSNQCSNGCCSSEYSNDGQLKCTPLEGGFRSDYCVVGGDPSSPGPSPTTTTAPLGDWVLCTSSNQCSNGCCSSEYSHDGQLKCTPLEGGFRSDYCVVGGDPSSPVPSPTLAPPGDGGTCGNGDRGDGVCADGSCCSEYGWCGTGPEHCEGGGSTGGGGDEASTIPTMSPVAPPSVTPGTCGNGDRGDGVCADGSCCSEFGWCGTEPEHCEGSDNDDSGTGSPQPPGAGTVSSPAIQLTVDQLQAGLNAKGDSGIATVELVQEINEVTASYTLYRQLAFVAHTIWESGSFQFKEEMNTENHGNYQDCDFNDPAENLPTTGKLYYGRGYLQLSWCYNYKAYGADRMVNDDPDLFYNHPELVAEDDFYAMDSAAWFFEKNVPDETGQFGLTTKSINGQIECSGGSNDKPKKRYQIFVALANAAGLTGYSESGCYN